MVTLTGIRIALPADIHPQNVLFFQKDLYKLAQVLPVSSLPGSRSLRPPSDRVHPYQPRDTSEDSAVSSLKNANFLLQCHLTQLLPRQKPYFFPKGLVLSGQKPPDPVLTRITSLRSGSSSRDAADPSSTGKQVLQMPAAAYRYGCRKQAA